VEQGARRFVVRGLVQGVGFRWWVRSLARQLELHGSVRNLDDGSVELIAFGNHSALGQLREQLRIGPAGARVDDLEEAAWTGSSPEEFRIER
jgi:acylphosphatase